MVPGHCTHWVRDVTNPIFLSVLARCSHSFLQSGESSDVLLLCISIWALRYHIFEKSLEVKHQLWQHNQEDQPDRLYYWDSSAGIASVLCLKAATGQEVWEKTQVLVQTSSKSD